MSTSELSVPLVPRDLADDWRPLVPFEGRMEQRFAAPPSAIGASFSLPCVPARVG